MVKALKIIILQNQESFEVEFWYMYIASGMWGLPNLFKWWSWINLWLFYGKVKFASLYTCMGTMLKSYFLKMYSKTNGWTLEYMIKGAKLFSYKPQGQFSLYFMRSLWGAFYEKEIENSFKVILHWPEKAAITMYIENH